MITESILSKLESLHAASTGGKWLNAYPNACKLSPMPDHVWTSEKELVCKDLCPQDAEFIAAAHNHLPALIAEVRRLRQELENANYGEILRLRMCTVELNAEIRGLREENIALKAEVERLEVAENNGIVDAGLARLRFEKVKELEGCLREIIALTDRRHEAWDRAKAALGESK